MDKTSRSESADGKACLMKLKNLNKRIQRLSARIAKDTRKLEKLKRKLAAGPKKKDPAKAKGKKKDKGKKAGKSKQAEKTVKATAPVRKRKKRGHKLSPEGRAKLRALMNARWAAKRAAAGQRPTSGDTPQNSSPS